jgi:hypothetical protein
MRMGGSATRKRVASRDGVMKVMELMKVRMTLSCLHHLHHFITYITLSEANKQ